MIGAIIQAATSAIGGTYSAIKLSQQEPLLQQPTTAQNVSAFTTRSLADRLGAGTGLTDTAFNRYLDVASSKAQQSRASAQEAIRGAVIPTAVADRMIQEVFRNALAVESSALTDITVKDIEAAEKQVGQAISAEAIAGARADKLSEIDRFNIRQKEKLEEAKKEAITKLLLGLGQQASTTAASISDEIDKRKEEEEEAGDFENSENFEKNDAYLFGEEDDNETWSY